jgi:hypothetical protein
MVNPSSSIALLEAPHKSLYPLNRHGFGPGFLNSIFTREKGSLSLDGVTASTRALGGPAAGAATAFVSPAGEAGAEAAFGPDGEETSVSGEAGGGADEHARSARERGRAIV